MADHTLFVGLDVHKRTIAVATAPDVAGTSCTFFGTIANTPDALRRLCKKVAADDTELHFCYEAGPCGYVVQRRLSRLGHRCDVVAPPKRSTVSCASACRLAMYGIASSA